jgi:hypothetical protein
MPDDKDALNAETRARRALGVAASPPPLPQQRSDQARRRHHFVRDGEVPVVVLSGDGRSNTRPPADTRIADLEHALEAERAAHASAARSFQEAQAMIQSLQTRLAHAELASDEVIAAERRARGEAEKALHDAVAGGRTAVHQDDGRPAEPDAKSTRGERVRRATTAAKPAAAPKGEPEPVKWWTASYRAKRKRKPS